MNFETTITDTRLADAAGQPRLTIRLDQETYTLIEIDGGDYYGRLALNKDLAVLLGRILCSAGR